MEKKDKFIIAALLGFLFLLTAAGMFLVHFQGKERSEQKDGGKERYAVDHIRVVISTSDFSGIFHEEVVLTALEDLTLVWGEEDQEVKKGEQWTASAFFAAHGDTALCRFIPESGAGVVLQSVTRGYGQPAYEGCIEIRKTSQGFVIVNELPMETYLRYVVPSEMPASYGQEPLKAQAICARNFAYRHCQSPSYIEFDADLDDSIRYQVYNNSPANAEADQAIAATAGQLLMYQNSIVDAYYYSTSWGFTTDLSLWGSEVQPYYQSHWQGEGARSLDLANEEVFRKTLAEETGAYESGEPWYRWSTTISKERILENLKEIPMVDLEGLTDILIISRRTGGSVSQLALMGNGKTVTLTRESEIRAALLPKYEQVLRNDGSVMDGYEKLPSSFFTIDKNFKNGELVSVTVKGGGCGHGIGMSQNCAKALGNQGKTYQEILQYFYPGTRVAEPAV